MNKLPAIKSLVSCWDIDIKTIVFLLRFIEEVKAKLFYRYENYLKGSKCLVIGNYEWVKNELGPSLRFLGMEIEPVQDLAVLRDEDKFRGIVCIHTTKSCYSRYVDSLTGVSVLNAGDGFSENPLIAINDLFTIYEQKKRIENLKIGFCGNIYYSNVFRSLIFLLIKTNSYVGAFTHPLLYSRTFGIFGIKYFLESEEFLKNKWDVIYNFEFDSNVSPYKEILPKNEYEKYFRVSFKSDKLFVLSSDTSYYIRANEGGKINLTQRQQENSFYTCIALILWLARRWKKV